MVEWTECSLEEIGEIIGGATPSTKREDYYGGSIPWITPKDLSSFEGRFISRGERNITDEGFRSCSTKMLPKGAVLFTSRAPIGYVAIASQSVCTNQGFKSVVTNERADPLFVYYLLKHNREYIERLGSGTTFKEVSGKVMQSVKVRVPQDVHYQKKIASILDSLDSQIETNKQINENLQKQAQAIYREMFVSQGRTTTATIADVSLNVTDGVHNTIHDDPNGKFFLLSCKNIKGGHLSIGPNERTINETVFSKLRRRTRLSKGDILISSVGTVGELLLLNTEPTHYEFQRSVAIVKPNPQIISSYYLYESLTYQKNELINAAHGAVQQCLFISDIAGFPIGVPEPETLLKFNSIVAPIFDSITVNETTSITLRSIRDTLLPKLMSGEIDVSDVQL